MKIGIGFYQSSNKWKSREKEQNPNRKNNNTTLFLLSNSLESRILRWKQVSIFLVRRKCKKERWNSRKKSKKRNDLKKNKQKKMQERWSIKRSKSNEKNKMKRKKANPWRKLKNQQLKTSRTNLWQRLYQKLNSDEW